MSQPAANRAQHNTNCMRCTGVAQEWLLEQTSSAKPNMAVPAATPVSSFTPRARGVVHSRAVGHHMMDCTHTSCRPITVGKQGIRCLPTTVVAWLLAAAKARTVSALAAQLHGRLGGADMCTLVCCCTCQPMGSPPSRSLLTCPDQPMAWQSLLPLLHQCTAHLVSGTRTSCSMVAELQ